VLRLFPLRALRLGRRAAAAGHRAVLALSGAGVYRLRTYIEPWLSDRQQGARKSGAMMDSSQPDPAHEREHVERMIGDGRTFGQVEDAIEHFDLTDEQKSALWMLAWSRLSNGTQNRVAEGAWAHLVG
jgi:hypothetical protein